MVCMAALLDGRNNTFSLLWFIVLKRKCLCIKYSNVLAILSYSLYFWLILPIVRHCTAYGCSNWSNKVGCENLSCHFKHHSKHRLCYMVRAGTTEHLNILSFGKMCLEVCFPVLFAWVHYFHCWSWPKPLTFMCFHMETSELQAQL